MKKKILMLVSLIGILVAVLCGCATNLTPGDPTILYNPKKDMKIVKGVDAYELFKQAYTTYQNTDNYKMEVDFTFNGVAESLVNLNLYQNTFQTIIRNGNEYYEYYIVAGTGMSVPSGNGDEFYFNSSTNQCKVKYIRNDGNKVKLDKKKKVTANFTKVAWGSFNADNEESGINSPTDKVNRLKNDFHQYNWLDEKYLSTKTDRNVYMKDDKYYCTIMINTLTGDMRNEQTAVVKAIEKATGGNYDKFNEDTRMVAEIEKVGKTYRFTQFILMEDYCGVNEKVGKTTVKASQQYWHKFYYDDESIKIPELN